MTLKEHAREYAQLGWRVLPLYELDETGICTCFKGAACQSPGKHPRLPNGLKSASSNEYHINMWWGQWPQANIGIATGEGSGIVVIDVDDGGEQSLIGHDLPPTVEQITGSGGRHLIYAHPGGRVKSSTGILAGVDSRGDGGYIVVPPSNHKSGAEYEWRTSPFENQLAQAPAWWIDLLRQRRTVERSFDNVSDEIVLKQGQRNATLASLAGTMRAAGMGYDSIYAALLQVKSDPPMDEDEIAAIAKSICGYAITDDPEAQRIGDESAANVLQTIEETRKAELVRTPKAQEILQAPMMPTDGLIRDIAQYILSQSELPQPDLAVAAAAVYVGALVGRQVQTPTGLISNLSFVSLADSGSGKDKARSIIKRIAAVTGTEWAIGPDRATSGAALRAMIQINPSTMMMVDEFGLKLASATNTKASSHERDSIITMMELYSAAQSTDNGTAYADPALKKRIVLHRPCLCLYGTSTHKPFYDALSSGQGENGFLARLLVVDAGHVRPEWQDCTPADVPEDIIQQVKVLSEIGGNMRMADCTVPVDPFVIPYAPGVAESVRELAARGILPYMTTDHAKSIYNRVVENALKMALVHAVSRGLQAIDDDAWLWARNIALRSAAWMVRALDENVADTLTQKYHKKLVEFVRNAGKEGVSKRDILRKFTMLRKYERDELILDVLDSGQAIQTDKIGAKGHTIITLVHADFIE